MAVDRTHIFADKFPRLNVSHQETYCRQPMKNIKPDHVTIERLAEEATCKACLLRYARRSKDSADHARRQASEIKSVVGKRIRELGRRIKTLEDPL